MHIISKVTERHFSFGRFSEKKRRHKPIELINPSKKLRLFDIFIEFYQSYRFLSILELKFSCINDNLPEPEFDITPNRFILVFYIRNNNQMLEDIGNVNGGVNGDVNFGVNETERKVIELMLGNPQIKTQEIADRLGFTKRNVEYAINSLKKGEYIERIGADKRGYRLVKSKE